MLAREIASFMNDFIVIPLRRFGCNPSWSDRIV